MTLSPLGVSRRGSTLRRTLFGPCVLLCGLSLLGASLGCSADPTLRLDYTTVLVDAGRDEPLEFEDERYAFTFEPTKSGIVFEIRNRTGERAQLLWDGSYFVDPGGNTFRALHTDILRERSEIVEKAQYASVIAPGSKLRRFTTSSIAASGRNAREIHRAVDDIRTRRVVWDAERGEWDWVGPRSERVIATASGDVTIPEVSWRVSEYWPSEIRPRQGQSPEQALQHLVENGLRGRERIGLGFLLEQGGEQHEYHFEFEIASVFAYQLITHSEGFVDAEGAEKRRRYTTRELKAVLRYRGGGWGIQWIDRPEEWQQVESATTDESAPAPEDPVMRTSFGV